MAPATAVRLAHPDLPWQLRPCIHVSRTEQTIIRESPLKWVCNLRQYHYSRLGCHKALLLICVLQQLECVVVNIHHAIPGDRYFRLHPQNCQGPANGADRIL